LFRLRVFGEESSDPQRREQQYRSLKALASLTPHPHICPAWPHPNERKLVVEVSKWVDAMTLKQRLLETGCMRWPLAAKITLGVAKALNHIHNSEAAFIHRNVNPEAILLSCDNEPALTDFELVYDPAAYYTVMGEENEDLLTPYTAPETFRGAPDFKSDVYALGVTLYEMLVGNPPGRDFQALAKAGGCLAEAHINALPRDVPDNLTSLLRKMVDFELQHRPEASTIVERLTALLGEAASDTASLELKPGHTLNTWTLENRIAEGTASTIYLGDNLGEKAVLKIYKPNYPRDLCVQERDMLASVDSPYVARYKSFMQWDDGRWCLAEEAIDGHSLRHFIEQGQRPYVEDFQRVTSQLLAALQSMHPRPDASPGTGVIHNDVNPNNIIYNDTLGAAKLIDFGVASRPGPVSIRGTRGYIAPDLMDHGELEACPETDLHALAVTLFEWITGMRPETKEQLASLVVEGIEAGQLERLTQWFATALGIESKRFDSAQEMRQALEAVFTPPEAVIQSQKPVPLYPNTDGEIGTLCDAERFVDYLNTIHNATASNRNALAEAQAVSEFFGSIYVPFPLIDKLYVLFQRAEEDVCILTGHAGDGKSTIALDLLKRLRGIAPEGKLDRPASAEETIEVSGHRPTVCFSMLPLIYYYINSF
jgi:serine/threonine protein kinase